MRVSKLFFALTKLSVGIVLTGWSIASIFKSPPVAAAEKISFSLSILGEFSISVDDLAVFAEDGTITPEFGYYANRLDEKTLQQLRQILQTSIPVEPITVYRLTNMPMGEDFLRRLGKIIYTHPQRNGIYGIRAALIQAAGEPEGLTAINILRHFPTQEMQLDTNAILAVIREAESFFAYKDSTIKAIATQAAQEARFQSNINFSNVPDLSQSGEYQTSKKTVTFPIDDLRQTDSGFVGAYALNADIYTPKALRQPAPLVIIAHGLGSQRSDFAYLAQHLASHGYIVAIPEHIGSGDRYQRAYLRGEVNVAVSPVEFYSRPRDITHLLDKLEQDPDYQDQINWSQVGILGHSFGGMTALLASGAPLNLARVRDTCDRDNFTLNVSLFLQCRASNLPPGGYNLQDERIKAVTAINPVTSSVLGIESMQQIELPTLIMGGTRDFVSPYIEEQVHPFLWLKTSHKYLATIVDGTHFSTINEANITGVNDFLKGSNTDIGRNYLKVISLAFFETHLRNNPNYQSFLTAAYGQNISNPKLPLHLIRSLDSQQLESAYGDTPPTSPIPEILVGQKSEQNRNILAEIEQTGVLKVAIRSDAAPFGYKDRDNALTGYCVDLANTLGDRLTKKLGRSKPIKVEKIISSSTNRFKLIKEEQANLECGPNSINRDRKGVVFSDPFFSSGTRFLVSNKVSRLDLDSSLEDMKLGVLQDTTTKKFLQRNYPDAEIVTFANANGRNQGVEAVKNGDLDAFVSDGVLLSGEMDRQEMNRKNYRTIPEKPLTCDYYGLILPQGDYIWRNTINRFIHDTKGYESGDRSYKKVFDRWLRKYYDRAVADLDYCQNRRE